MRGPCLEIVHDKAHRCHKVVMKSGNGVVMMATKPHRSLYMAKGQRTSIGRIIRQIVARKAGK